VSKSRVPLPVTPPIDNAPKNRSPVLTIAAHLRSATDAISRAADRVYGDSADFFDLDYASQQISRAIGYLAHAQVVLVDLTETVVEDAVGDLYDDQPPTADLLPNAPADDVTEGGAA
jgi:hypothetical protein